MWLMRITYNHRALLIRAILLVSCAVFVSCAASHQERGPRGKSSVEVAEINKHCRNPELARQLRDLGPVYTVGASVSHGLFSDSFPKLVADQMCLEKDAYDADFEFLFFYKSPRMILKTILKHRPNIIISLDYPYHHVKLKYAQMAKPILKNYVSMLLLECESDLIDCSEDGPYRELRDGSYKPMVFAGTIYFDCNLAMRPDHAEREMPFTSYEECREENEKLNMYYRELEKQFPNLHLLPAYDILSAFHDSASGKYRYSINNVQRLFTKEELFFDGFHPKTDPGAYVLANVVIDGINRAREMQLRKSVPLVPYIPIRESSAGLPRQGMSSAGAGATAVPGNTMLSSRKSIANR